MNKWLSLAKVIAPLALHLIPGMPLMLVPLIVHAISEAEQIKGATGAKKKAIVEVIAEAGIASLNTLPSGPVIDLAIAKTAVSAGIDASVAAINAVADVKAKKAAKKKKAKTTP